MKFIKTDDGNLINVDRVQFFYVTRANKVNAVFGIGAHWEDRVYSYNEVTIKKFKTRDEAETWLDATFKSVTCHVDD